MLRTSTATIVFESHPSHGSTVGLSVLDSSDAVGGSSSNIRALYRLSPRREAFGAGGIQPRAGYVQTIETLEVGSQFDRVDADLRFEAIDFPSWSV